MSSNHSFTAAVCVGLILTLIFSAGAFAKGTPPPGGTRPKIVLDGVSDSPDPFSPLVNPLTISADYRILPTDSLVGAANGKTGKTFYIRQKIEILNASGVVVRILEQDFPIDSTGIKNASEYIQISASAAWDGKNKDGALVPDGSYTYKVSGIYLRVDERGNDRLHEKEIASSDTLQGDVSLDATAPITHAKVSPAANESGWHKVNAAVDLSATDNLTGVAKTFYKIGESDPVEGTHIDLSDEDVYSILYWSADNVGNIGKAKEVIVRIDKTDPEITLKSRTPEANEWNWNNGPVTVTYEVSDALSGVDEQTGSYEPDTVETEGKNQQVEGSVTDLAGNTASITVDGINIDLTNPTITAEASGTQGENGWWTSEMTISYTTADELSGVDPELGDSADDVLGEGANQSAEGDVYDKAGNHASTEITDIDVDLTPPAIAASLDPQPNAAGWNNSDVIITFIAEDQEGLSGLASVTDPQTLTEEGENQSVAGEATDNAGNSAELIVLVNIDKTPPAEIALESITFEPADSAQIEDGVIVTVENTLRFRAPVESDVVRAIAFTDDPSLTVSAVIESVRVDIVGLYPGDHVVTVRLIDRADNMTKTRFDIKTLAPGPLDSDGDGIPDVVESAVGLDPYDPTDAEKDLDEDGLSNLEEYETTKTSIDNADTDGDGMSDGWEYENGLDPLDPSGDNGGNGDLDEDGDRNVFELQIGTQPNDAGSGLAGGTVHIRYYAEGDTGRASGGGPTGIAYSEELYLREHEWSEPRVKNISNDFVLPAPYKIHDGGVDIFYISPAAIPVVNIPPDLTEPLPFAFSGPHDFDGLDAEFGVWGFIDPAWEFVIGHFVLGLTPSGSRAFGGRIRSANGIVLMNVAPDLRGVSGTVQTPGGQDVTLTIGGIPDFGFQMLEYTVECNPPRTDLDMTITGPEVTTFGQSNRQEAPKYMADPPLDALLTIEVTLEGFQGLNAIRKVTLAWPGSAFSGAPGTGDPGTDQIHVQSGLGTETFVWTLKRTSGVMPDNAKIAASVEAVVSGGTPEQQANFERIIPVSFGTDQNGDPIMFRPQATASGESTSVVAVEKVIASSEKAHNSPVEFEGGQTDIGDPCARDAADRAPALEVYYNDVSVFNLGTGKFDVDDFDILIEGHFNPSNVLFPEDLLQSMTWTKVDGPASGEWGDRQLRVEGLDDFYYGKTYKNPKLGGVYDFEFGFCNNSRTKAYVRLPVAGADLLGWLLGEVRGAKNWAVTHKSDVVDANYSPIPGVTAYRVLLTYIEISGVWFDYALAPVDQNERTPCQVYMDLDDMRKHLYDGGDFGYITTNGVVVHASKINNMLWAIFSRSWGFSCTAIKTGAHINEYIRNRRLDPPASQQSIDLGCEIFDGIEEGFSDSDLTWILRQRNLRELRAEDELIDEKLWPSPYPYNAGNSTLERPTLPLTPPED